MSDATQQELLRRQNETTVLNLIRVNAPVSRIQLSTIAGMTPQTVSNAVKRLMQEGLIVEVGVESTGNVGRNPINLDIHPSGAFAIGINVETDRLTKGLINLRGDMVHHEVDVIPAAETPENVVQRIIDYIHWVRNNPQFTQVNERIIGVGIGTPGPIDYDAGEVISPPNLTHWNRVPLRDMVQSQVQIPVILDNSATVSAIGEHWRGRWAVDSFLYCYWGVGIGGGLITKNELYRGISGNAIEFGHTVVVPNGRRCACGGVGCLEAYASARAILEEASLIKHRHVSLEELAREAKPGTEFYRILVRAAEQFALSLTTTLNLLDVNYVIIGGCHFRDVQHIFLPVIQDYLNNNLFRRAVRKVEIGVSSLGEEAGAIGAASLVFHEMLPKQDKENNVVA